MNHPEYKEGAYLFSPISDDRPARFWPTLAVAVAAPLALMLAAHFLCRCTS